MAEKRSKLEIDTTIAWPDADINAQRLRYVGDGEYIPGVPARDLSAEEMIVYAAQIEATQAATGRILYEVAMTQVEKQEE